jgi:DNA mismatch repair protein MutS
LDSLKQQIILLTGPNMAGKSALLRQTALIVLMAQIGCFVPAESARIGWCDKIFTRVGASDNISRGESTFMVEMLESATILHNLSERSLILLDEIGRGTATFDGMSIARGIVEYIHEYSKGAKTLFATHYHELTELEGKLSGVNNYCIAVKEKGDDIVFLRKIVKGGADKSYGIQVAKLAGLPDTVIERAKEIVNELVNNDITEIVRNISVDTTSKRRKKEHLDEVDLSQMSLFDTLSDDNIIDELRNVDIGNMTPLDALNKLYELQNKVKNRWSM